MEGMNKLLEKISEPFKQNIIFNSEVTKIENKMNKKVHVSTKDNQNYIADYVYLLNNTQFYYYNYYYRQDSYLYSLEKKTVYIILIQVIVTVCPTVLKKIEFINVS